MLLRWIDDWDDLEDEAKRKDKEVSVKVEEKPKKGKRR